MAKSSTFWEFCRKTAHLSGLLIVIGYTLVYEYFSPRTAILAVTALLLILIEVERIRLDYRPKIANLFDGLFRKHEKTNISGAVYLVISCIIAFSAFDYWVAFLALFMTVFGDLSAAIFGTLFGKKKIYGNNTVIGTLAGFVTNLAVGFLIMPEFILLIVPMAITASFVEFITIRLDDNLTVPLFAGFVGQTIVFYSDLVLPPIDFTFLGLL